MSHIHPVHSTGVALGISLTALSDKKAENAREYNHAPVEYEIENGTPRVDRANRGGVDCVLDEFFTDCGNIG